jgi:hypothetical protein
MQTKTIMPPIISSYLTKTSSVLVGVVFNFDQARQAFEPRAKEYIAVPDKVLCVQNNRCKWVTNAEAAYRFYNEGAK